MDFQQKNKQNQSFAQDNTFKNRQEQIDEVQYKSQQELQSDFIL